MPRPSTLDIENAALRLTHPQQDPSEVRGTRRPRNGTGPAVRVHGCERTEPCTHGGRFEDMCHNKRACRRPRPRHTGRSDCSCPPVRSCPSWAC
eukprot:scaffold25664_cov119-Isochrysis_galbana.AAC.1